MRTLTPLTRQRGIALVETAITLPFLLFVMLAATEFTNAFVTHTTLTKAVRDGARWAAEDAIDNTGFNLTPALQLEAQNLVVYGNPAGTGAPAVAGLTVTDVTVVRLPASENIQVSVTFPYAGILGSVLPSFGYGANISTLFNMSATSTMRAL
mgnify:CR=1 FL=1